MRFREARDAATIGRALLGGGGAIAYSELGAYRYLVHIPAATPARSHASRRRRADRLRPTRRTALLDTLERYLAERRSVVESARELYIHPNTLRQRLGRIEDLTGLNLDEDDLLSLEARDQAGPPARATSVGAGRLSVSFANQEHGDLGLAADPLRFLGPGEVADDAAAVGVGGHHDHVAAGDLRLVDDLLGCGPRADYATVGVDPLATQELDDLAHHRTLLVPFALGRQQAGVRKAEGHTVDAGDR